MGEGPYLIAGLGNPGEKYRNTRHNLGFLVVHQFAEKLGAKFRREPKLKGVVADALYEGKKIIFLKPMTYMNLSGPSVRSSVQFFKIKQEELLIVTDDVYLKFGTMRLKSEGSAGGHNGLKSIEGELKTQNYCRLRMGVGNEDLPGHTLEEFVLANFTPQERENLSSFLEKGVAVLETWISQGIVAAMQNAGNLSKELNKL